ncbi:MAG TPA: sugar kinase [Candidatus Cloacimonetes bacterium]|nr:sugar kinase [Candidatus Cloacimonadota bacterium]HEX38137.1 sugar kinase [Candidatus Cloacimonadota bacterium]
MSLLIVGTIGLDSIENPHGKVHEVLGGSAVYASVAASFLYDNVSIIGVVGEDFPSEHIMLLKSRGVNTDSLHFAKGKTFRWKGRYNNLNQAITLDTQLNVFQNFNPKIPEDLQESPFVLLGNIDPEIQLNVIRQIKKPKLIAADTMNYWIIKKFDQLIEMMMHIDLLFINDEEIKLLTQKHYLYDASQKALEYGPSVIVVKKGEHGVMVVKKDFYFFAPGYPLERVIDTTGAGDCFSGGFMGYIASKGTITETILKQAAIMGTISSAFNVEGFSVDSLKNISKEKIQARFRDLKKFTQFE